MVSYHYSIFVINLYNFYWNTTVTAHHSKSAEHFFFPVKNNYQLTTSSIHNVAGSYFYYIFNIIYGHSNYQQFEEVVSINTKLNLSNNDSQFKVQMDTNNVENIMKIMYFSKENNNTIDLLSISTINETILLSKKIQLPASILNIQFLGENGRIIVAALSSNQIVLINETSDNPYTFLGIVYAEIIFNYHKIKNDQNRIRNDKKTKKL